MKNPDPTAWAELGRRLKEHAMPLCAENLVGFYVANTRIEWAFDEVS